MNTTLIESCGDFDENPDAFDDGASRGTAHLLGQIYHGAAQLKRDMLELMQAAPGAHTAALLAVLPTSKLDDLA
ncbi:MAG: hypothetical protein NTV22_04950, partial [bacterium]|nr:hypothetical protein [bacterium]